MGQGEVIKVLEKSKVPLSRTQIADKLDDRPEKISKVIRVLIKTQQVKCIELDRHQSAKLLNWDVPIRRTRFYYV